MTAVAKRPHPPVDAAQPAAAVSVGRAPRRHWRPGLLWLAVGMVAAGGLLGTRVLLAVAASGEYLAVIRPIQAGAALTRQDLTTVRITVDPALRPVTASAAAQVVGKHAAVALLPGTLLTDAALTAQPMPGPGQQLVGIGVPQDRLPAQRVKAASTVLLVITADDAPTADTPSATGPPPSIRGTVVDIGPGVPDGTVLLSVAVPERDGPTLATHAAAGRLVVVLTAGG